MAKRKEDRDLEPAPNSLAGLPTELLVIIVSDLVTRRDLFSLARVCRRLNDVAMTCWLRSRTLKRYSTFCSPFEYSRKYSPLIYYPAPGWPMPFSTFADLRLCFATKPHIPSMTLTFGTQYIKEHEEFSRYVDTIPSDRTCPILHIKLHMPRFPIDTRAFNAFCTELTEYNSVASFQVIQQSGERVHMSLRDTKGPNHQPIFHPPPFTTLTELHIQSVSKQLDDWLLRSVAASPICNLTILDNASLPYGRICLPTIRKLTLGDRTMTTSQLIQFLSDEAHSSLRELTFMPKAEPYWEIPVKGRLIPLSMNAMPSLTSLAAEFKVLTNLLVTPEAFPKLERVEVYGIGSNESSAAEDGAELLTRIMSLPSVHCVTFPVGALESGDWDNLSGSGIVLPNVTKLIDQWSLRAPSILSQVRKVFPNVVGVDSPSQSQA